MLFKDFLDEIITGYENEGVIISLNELRSEELFISYNTKRVFVYDVSICEKYLKWSKSWVSSDHLEKWSNIQKFINHLFSRQRVKLFGAAEWFYLLSSYSRQKWIILVQDVIATASSMLTWIVEKEDLNTKMWSCCDLRIKKWPAGINHPKREPFQAPFYDTFLLLAA